MLALAGMALGFLMTSPSPDQLADFRGIAGAHTDGGPGLPLVGWSTLGGDLRVPHFVGMYALQLLPLLLIVFELAAGRVARPADPRVRRDLMTTAADGYTGLLALLTWQALRGQPLVAPDALTVAAAGALTVLVVAGAVVALRERRPVLTPGR
ncbi:hypothetical protein ACFU8R_07370 [Pseudonocardia alni]|uniref:hypothetical protein n=1 Tax=Pseudonocardia TaxID=1847 RepID=UPI000911B844|nr:hypothetical protein [Pseudonocardia sp. SID8383]MYW74310.1 hypothetical protein [Pseudonocardia sp. SID8383]OJG04244.1 hypothetical protein BG618_04654 [Pseudonocardia autotrophica]